MKKIFFTVALFLLTFSLFAIPGVVDIIPTESGQYVYYKDSSFTWEAYIGFIQYNAETYGIRYYAPQPETGSNDIEILITIDSTIDYVLMTGEKIVSTVTMDDNTVINYLHDIFYELVPRRKKVDFDYIVPKTDIEFAQTKKTIHDDFYQYGGEVLMEYDLNIPIFNLRSITSDNKKVFEAVTIGQLTETGDPAFANFKGFPQLPEKTKNPELVIEDLASKWINQEGFLFIGNKALLYSYDVEFPGNFNESHNFSIYDFIAKDFSLSGLDSYVYLPEQKIEIIGNTLVISNAIYIPALNQYTKDYKVLKPYENIENTTQLYNIALLSAFHETYYSNKEDFDKTINSFIRWNYLKSVLDNGEPIQTPSLPR